MNKTKWSHLSVQPSAVIYTIIYTYITRIDLACLVFLTISSQSCFFEVGLALKCFFYRLHRKCWIYYGLVNSSLFWKKSFKINSMNSSILDRVMYSEYYKEPKFAAIVVTRFRTLWERPTWKLRIIYRHK